MVAHTSRVRKPAQYLEFARIADMAILLPPTKSEKKKTKKVASPKKASPKKAVKKAAPLKKAPKMLAAKPTKAAKKSIVVPTRVLNAPNSVGVLQRGNSKTGSILLFKWQYWADTNKWADFDGPASKALEKAYADWMKNPHVDVRSVKSGQYHYMVDFNMMQQQNVDHSAHRVRKINRIANT
jgi:hypothetical protein